jgi:hypothetical protein
MAAENTRVSIGGFYQITGVFVQAAIAGTWETGMRITCVLF